MLRAIQRALLVQPPHIKAPERVEGHALVPPIPLARAKPTHIVSLRAFFVEIIRQMSHMLRPLKGRNASNDTGKRATRLAKLRYLITFLPGRPRRYASAIS